MNRILFNTTPVVAALPVTMRLMFLLLVAAFVFTPWPAPADDMMSDMMSQQMQQLRGRASADRNMLVSTNMQLTDAESNDFWPVYQAYLNDLQQLNRKFAEIIQSYILALRSNSLSDDMAKQLTDQFLAAQEEEVKLRTSYAVNLAKVLPGKTVARALQIENKIRAVAWFGMASQIPLVKQ